MRAKVKIDVNHDEMQKMAKDIKEYEENLESTKLEVKKL
jgi:uncharacterized protein YukE